MAEDSVTRRRFVAAAGTLAARPRCRHRLRAAIAAVALGRAPPARFPRGLGSGGRPTTDEAAGGAGARARTRRADDVRRSRRGRSQRQADRPTSLERNGWHVRPALKVFQSPQLCAYILHLLPEPRGLVFHLRTVDQIMTAAPAGTDLLMGYPPTRGELRAYLGSAPPRGQRRHRLTLLASSVEILAGHGAARAGHAPAAAARRRRSSSTRARGAAAFTIRRDQRGDQAAAARAPRACGCAPSSATTATRRPPGPRAGASSSPSSRASTSRATSSSCTPRAATCTTRDADPQRPRELQLPQLGGQARDQRDQPWIGVRVRRLPCGRVRQRGTRARADAGGAGAQGRRPVPVDPVHQDPDPADHRRGVLPQGVDLARPGRHPAAVRLSGGRPRR